MHRRCRGLGRTIARAGGDLIGPTEEITVTGTELSTLPFRGAPVRNTPDWRTYIQAAIEISVDHADTILSTHAPDFTGVGVRRPGDVHERCPPRPSRRPPDAPGPQAVRTPVAQRVASNPTTWFTHMGIRVAQ
jgi:hypothetical protein